MKADKIVFATGNADKMREIRMILSDLGLAVWSMKEAGITVDIVEDGKTFGENAMIKASAIARELKKRGEQAVVLADDSGLEIDYLNKEPGIYSASRTLADKISGHNQIHFPLSPHSQSGPRWRRLSQTAFHREARRQSRKQTARCASRQAPRQGAVSGSHS